MKRYRHLTAALTLAAALGGCDRVGTEPVGGAARVSFSLTSAPAAGRAGATGEDRRDARVTTW